MSKEKDFKERLVAVLRDMKDNAAERPETMFLVGSLASRMILRAVQPSWAAYNASLLPQVYSKLIGELETQGNDFYKQGKDKHTWAIQALAVSLVAARQNDLEVKHGGALLDQRIDYYITAFRKAERLAQRQSN